MSKWRETYPVHPAADIFPMMSDEELQKLGEDIKANGLNIPILLWGDKDNEPVLVDGRNRLEAMERAGVELQPSQIEQFNCGTPVSHIISLNIRRRHLTKQQQADLIVAAHLAAAAKHARGEQVSKGGRGKVDPVKAAVVASAEANDISKSTARRSLAKARGAKPKRPVKPKRINPAPSSKPMTVTIQTGIEAARKHYAAEFALLAPSDHDAETTLLIETLREATKQEGSA